MTQLLVQTKEEQIRAVREGLPFSSFVMLKKALELSTDDLARLLGVPRRTLTKRQQGGLFNPSESNALSRVARVYREAVAFFGDEAEARTWLKTPLPALGGTPLSLLDTDPGAEAVSVLLRHSPGVSILNGPCWRTFQQQAPQEPLDLRYN